MLPVRPVQGQLQTAAGMTLTLADWFVLAIICVLVLVWAFEPPKE